MTKIASSDRVLIMGFYGRRNFGDDIMARALIEQLHDRGITRIGVFCDDPSFLSGLSASAVPRTVRSLTAEILKSDILIQGGGTIFHDSYTGKALYRYYVNLLLYAVIFAFARISATRVLVVGAGIGPVRRWLPRVLCGVALSFADMVVVRDRKSESELLRLIPRRRAFLSGHDLALLPDPRAFTAEPVRRRRIGISLCDLTPFMIGDGKGPWNAMASALHRLEEEGKDEPFELHFLSLYTGTSSVSDAGVSRDVAALLPGYHCTFADYSNDPSLFWQEIASCEAVVATKFHAVVAAAVLGRPTLAVSYNRKVSDFCGETDFDPEMVLPLEVATDPDIWTARLRKLLAQTAPPVDPATLNRFREEMIEAMDKAIVGEGGRS